MNTTKVTLSAVLGLVILTSSAFAQRGALPTPRPTNAAPADVVAPVSAVHGKATLLQSHIKSLGTIGKTDRYEITQVKVRGLDTPNLTSILIYDRETDTILVTGNASAPGLGVAIVNGAAQVGGNFLFGSSIKPDQQNINNGSASVSEGSTAVSLSKGGNATGGNATGGTANSLSGANANSKSGAVSGSSSTVKNQNSNSSVNVNDNQNKNSSVNNNSNKNDNNNTSSSKGNIQSQEQGQWQDQGQWQQNSQQNFPKYH